MMYKIYLYYLMMDEKIKYVGITINPKRRKYWHSKNQSYPHTFIVIKEFDDLYTALSEEVKHIDIHNTFRDNDCWNKSPGGDGYPIGVSRKGIGGRKKGEIREKGIIKYSDETKKLLSDIRKGFIWSSKLTEDQITGIRYRYENKEKYEDDAVNSISKNGKLLPYDRYFSKMISKEYNVTAQCIYKIIKSESWTNAKLYSK